MSDETFEAIKAAALHCLDRSAPGVANDLRKVIANNIARRAVHALLTTAGGSLPLGRVRPVTDQIDTGPAALLEGMKRP